MARLFLFVESRLLVLKDFMLVVNSLSIMLLVVDGFSFTFEVHLLPTCITVGLHQLSLRLAGLIIKFTLARLQLCHLLLQNVELRIKNELLTFDFE